jgi:MFS transporter, MCT family, solute carrier family 16 (monocarboxylic acid transporters), member 10
MRSIALIQLCTFGISNLTLRMRVVPASRQGAPFDFCILKSPAFLFYFSSALFTFMGSTTLMSYLGVSALARGVDPGVAAYLLAILNASSTIGRVSSGLLADRFGTMLVYLSR